MLAWLSNVMTEVGGAIECTIDNISGADRGCVSATIVDRAFLDLLPKSLTDMYEAIAIQAAEFNRGPRARRIELGRDCVVRVHMSHMWGDYGVRRPRAGDLLLSWRGGEAPVCDEREHEPHVGFYSGMVVIGAIAARASLDCKWPLLILDQWRLRNGVMPPTVTSCSNARCPGFWTPMNDQGERLHWKARTHSRRIPGWNVVYNRSKPAIEAGIAEVLSTWPNTMIIVHGIADRARRDLPSRTFPIGWARSSTTDLGAARRQPSWPPNGH